MPINNRDNLKEYQIVIAAGPSVRNCKVGDLIKINPSAYAQYKQRKVPSIAEDVEGYQKTISGLIPLEP